MHAGGGRETGNLFGVALGPYKQLAPKIGSAAPDNTLRQEVFVVSNFDGSPKTTE